MIYNSLCCSRYGSRREQLNLFAKAQPAKKRRKSRTAFTNQQIYELEKRFLYQKYLTPADRDEIAQSLGLTNAQVITWFQNRRAKLKRDLEELKADVTAAKHLSDDDTVLPNVVQIDEIQLFNKHGLKRVEKKPSQTTTATTGATGVGAAASSGSESAAIPAPDPERTRTPDNDVPRRSGSHAQSPVAGACASAFSSPDSTTHPKDASTADCERPRDQDCDMRQTAGNTEAEVDRHERGDDDDDDEEEIDV
ncbi:hypothetical protein LSH36_814g03056 [Paralvinella palmiformis]|uniref:Homeobox domain-containing protein n=1 Tax=Paralvinella palmiformis TaxID=53620 RepID=A0AAD9J026_9ANNE|nr:hypothetical protein LSH36_814g03056 [Paralvinella palmiformis]